MLSWLDGQAQGFNAWRLVSMTPLSAPALAALAAVGILALFLSWRALGRASRRQRAVLMSLRLLAAGVVAALVLEPGAELLQTQKERARLAVLIDGSASMAQADGDRTRAQRLRAWLRSAQPGLDRLAEDHDIEIWRFSTKAQRVADLPTALAMEPRGEGSDLQAALDAVAPSRKRTPLAAALLLSDGADTGTLQGRLARGEGPALLGAPLYTVALGAPERFRDAAIVAIHADDFAFVRNPVEVEVVVSAQGIELPRLPVTLSQGGQVLAVKNVDLDPDQPEQRVRFRITPKQTGKMSYRVDLPELEGEAIVDNNHMAFALKVIRDRMRVLQVAGRPSWDVRYLRQLLKANPSVDLISFFILRTHSDMAGSNDELSLIPFPTRELFTQELGTFDVVIFQNCNYRPYQMGIYLDNVRRFVVEQGGGFVMIGGDLSFSEADYQVTPLAEILPVRLLPRRGHYQRAAFRPVLTEAGAQHPLLDLGREPARQILGALPALHGFNLSAGATRDAQVLLRHPFEKIGGLGAPLIALREVGKGRSLAVLTDDTWRWSLTDAVRGGRGTAHRRFWANALRWLIRDPALSRVRVELSRQGIESGDSAELHISTYDVSYRGLAGARLDIELSDDLTAGGVLWRDRQISDEAGQAQLRVPAQAPGAYRVQVRATAPDGTALGRDDAIFVVRAASPELLAARPRPRLLQDLARQTGGRLLRTAAELGDISVRDAARVRVLRARRVALWDRLPVVVLLVGLVALEWWLRRRWGFS